VTAAGELFFFDTNAIIEAVRTAVWNPISGGLRIETVEEVRQECLQGDQLSSLATAPVGWGPSRMAEAMASKPRHRARGAGALREENWVSPRLRKAIITLFAAMGGAGGIEGCKEGDNHLVRSHGRRRRHRWLQRG
jgi:hypothetical protein